MEMGEALRTCGRDIVYSMSNAAPLAVVPTLYEYAQLWRSTGDIRDTWKSVKSIAFDKQEAWSIYRRPGGWPDADMMVLGRVGWGKGEHPINPTQLTPDEQYTHMTMWAILASPLILGCDLTKADDFLVSLLTNNEVIAVNQDELGLSPARIYGDNNEYAIYEKPLADGSLAIAMFNLGDAPRKLGFYPINIGLLEGQTVRDLWRQQDVAAIKYNEKFEAELPLTAASSSSSARATSTLAHAASTTA